MKSASAFPWLSILMPVYNAEAYLVECVESILSQAESGVEVLLLDDRSTDGSWQLMQQMHASYGNRLRLLRHASNQGVSIARNTLLDAANGDYVWFLDADDRLNPRALATVAEMLRRYAPDLLMFDYSILRERAKVKHRLRGEGHRRSFLGPSHVGVCDMSVLLHGMFLAGQFHPWSKVVRRACWGDGNQKVRFPEGQSFAEDMAAFTRLALRVNCAVHIPKALVQYRQHGHSATASMDIRKIQGFSSSLRVFSIELKALMHQQGDLTLDADAVFAISHLSARNYIVAMRFLTRHPQHRNDVGLARAFSEDFLATSLLSPRELLRAYLRKGWFLRYWRARKWLGMLQRGAL